MGFPSLPGDEGFAPSWEDLLERISRVEPDEPEPKEHLSVPCPTCGATEVIPLVFGLPGPELVEEQRRGRVSLPG